MIAQSITQKLEKPAVFYCAMKRMGCSPVMRFGVDGIKTICIAALMVGSLSYRILF
ncbi:hypothetical protein [Candidatus Liberibacter sp.]|uniref:hypothetical protein n=1 Tax=Candidatus Liberibacter sp. TaxID=34022 RepID=UPI0015F46659|nr:hypothetical protein [Candidatus Liberibacter sp.]MBA5724230.1 hypothetical protein [Candidatus Liberibacter sp.]